MVCRLTGWRSVIAMRRCSWMPASNASNSDGSDDREHVHLHPRITTPRPTDPCARSGPMRGRDWRMAATSQSHMQRSHPRQGMAARPPTPFQKAGRRSCCEAWAEAKLSRNWPIAWNSGDRAGEIRLVLVEGRKPDEMPRNTCAYARIDGMKGRPPTPTAVRVLEGMRGHRPLRHEPGAFGAPSKPPSLKGRAGAFWRSVVPELQRVGIVGTIDTPALVAMSECWAQLCAVDAALTANQGDASLQRRSNQLRASLLSYFSAFGLTPASRSRLAPPAPATDDTMHGLLQ